MAESTEMVNSPTLILILRLVWNFGDRVHDCLSVCLL